MTDEYDDLTIPDFLNRKKQKERMMTQEEEQAADAKVILDHLEATGKTALQEVLEATKQDSEPDQEDSVDNLLARIKTMTAQRDKLTEAISAHKKALQRQIGKM